VLVSSWVPQQKQCLLCPHRTSQIQTHPPRPCLRIDLQHRCQHSIESSASAAVPTPIFCASFQSLIVAFALAVAFALHCSLENRCSLAFGLAIVLIVHHCPIGTGTGIGSMMPLPWPLPSLHVLPVCVPCIVRPGPIAAQPIRSDLPLQPLTTAPQPGHVPYDSTGLRVRGMQDWNSSSCQPCQPLGAYEVLSALYGPEVGSESDPIL